MIRTLTHTRIQIDDISVEFDPNRQRFEIVNSETQARVSLNGSQAIWVKRALEFLNPGGFEDADS